MKKLEVLFSVFLVVVLVVPNLSLGAWTPPPGPFSIISPDPELPISEGPNPQSKKDYILVPQLKISDEVLSGVSNIASPSSLVLTTDKGITWNTPAGIFNSKFSVDSFGFFQFLGKGLTLPSLSADPVSPSEGAVYYNTNNKDVKLFVGNNTWKSIGSGGTAGATNPLLLKYGTGTNQYWSITSAADGSKGSKLSFSNPDGGDLVYINYNDNSGKGNLVLAPGTKLCFNGATSGADCKDVWPTAQQGGSSQWKDLTGGIYYDAGSVGVGGAPDSKYKFDVKSGYINLGDASSEVMIPGGGTLDNGFLIRSGGLVVNNGSEGQSSPADGIIIKGPNAPIDEKSAQDISWQFNAAGSAEIRAYRGGSWDTNLQFLTNSSTGGNNPQVRMTIASDGSVSIGSVTPKAALRVSGGTNQLYVDSDEGNHLDKDGGGYTQSEPIIFHVGGAQLIARNADFDGANWKRAKYGTVSAIAFGGGDERNDALPGDIQFLTAPYGDAGSNIGTFKNVLTIKNNGSIGIGTDNPTKKLDINGGGLSIKSGSIYFESPEFSRAPVLGGATGVPGGGLPAGTYYYAITYGGVDGGGETQTSGFTNIGIAISSGSGTAQFDITEPSDSRVGSFYIYRSNSGTLSDTYKRVGIWNLPKKVGEKTIIGNGTLEKTSSGYRFTDSGLPSGSAGLPPYPTFSAGFFLKSENESVYKPMLNFIRQSGDNRSFMGINTDRPSQMFEILGVGSVSSASANNKIEDPTDGVTARLRITDTINNPELQLQYGTSGSDHWGIYANRSNSSLNIWGYEKNILVISKDKGVKVDTNAFWNGYTWLPNGWTVSCTASGSGAGQPSMTAQLYVKDGLMYYRVKKGEAEVSNGTWASWDYIANNAGRVRGARAELVNVTGPAAGHNNWAFYAEIRWDGIYIPTAAWKKRSSQVDPFGGMLTPGPSLQVATFNSGSDSGHIGTYKHCGVDFLGNSSSW